jgi:hypothetical protein
MAATFWPGDFLKHKKSGGIYELLHFGVLEKNLEQVCIYRNVHSLQVYVRPKSEMTEERFSLEKGG